jgi:hypothetical protein
LAALATVVFLVEVLVGFAVAFVNFSFSAMKVSSVGFAANNRATLLGY